MVETHVGHDKPMAVFRFRLGSVLRFRERTKEEKRWEVRALNEARAHVESEIRELERGLRETTEELEPEQGGILSVADLKLQEEFTRHVLRCIQEKHGLLAIVQEKLAEKREELVEADRGVKTLEQLKHKLIDKHRREESRVEQKLIDEIGQRKSRRRS